MKTNNVAGKIFTRTSTLLASDIPGTAYSSAVLPLAD
jgi:hypothetical protein